MNLGEVLRLGNLARTAVGKKPRRKIPVGFTRSPDKCPIANLLDGGEVSVQPSVAFFKHREAAVAAKRAWNTTYVKRERERGAVGEACSQPTRWPGPFGGVKGWYGVRLPPQLQHFVYRFDHGVLPQFISKRQRREVS